MAALFGRRLRRGATSTAIAAAAIAALSASQAPGLGTSLAKDGGQAAGAADTPPPDSATGNSQYYTDLPPLGSTTPSTSPSVSDGDNAASADSGIPASVLAAYKQAEQDLKESNPGCKLPWQLLAAIGKVESGQARGGKVDANGTTLQPILGPVLDGDGFADITDTDNGKYDQDTVHDRAVGPMQFIPSTWQTWGRDANHDGYTDPNNIYDASLAAGLKLCAGNHDLSVQADMNAAILGYNQSQEYLNTVLSWYEYYKKGTHEIPDGTGTLPTGPGPLDPEPPSPHSNAGTPSAPPSGSPSPNHTPSAPHTTPPGGSGSPSTPPDSGSPKPPGKPTPPKPVLKQLVKTGGDTLSAVAGALFGGHASIRAEDSAGKPVAGVAVTFEIVGDTDAHFSGGTAKVTVTTGKDGSASAPAVQAGEHVGSFTVRASVAAAGVASADFKAGVTAHVADKLTLLSAGDVTAAPEAAFADPISVKATDGGATAAKVAVTASVLNADGSAAAPADGPSFKTSDGTLVKTLSGLLTGSDGSLQLPSLVAGKTEGTYLVKLTAEGGGTVTVTVKVAAPSTPSDPPSGDPSGDPSGAPSASPSAGA